MSTAALTLSPSVVESSDSEAVRCAQADPQAFGDLYDLYMPRIFSYVARRVGDQTLAEDVTAEVFLKAMRGLSRYRDTGRPFVAWLYQIAANCITDHYRRHREDIELQPAMVDATIDVVGEVIARERNRNVWAAVDQLPGAQRTAMLLKFGEDLSLAEVAGVMGKSPAAVKQLVFRGVSRLRHELRPLGR